MSRPPACWICGADAWHPPWDDDEPWRCVSCGNQVSASQLAAHFDDGAHVNFVAPIDLPLGPKLTVVRDTEETA